MNKQTSDIQVATKKQVKIILPKERPPSYNRYFSMHWADKRAITLDIHRSVRYQLLAQGFKIQKIFFSTPVKITITVYFAKDAYDCSNIPVKLYEDGLKDILIADDSPKYVRSIESISLIDKINPRVEIVVQEVD